MRMLLWIPACASILLGLALGLNSEAAAQALPNICPPPGRWVSGGGGIMCQCPDGSFLNLGQTCGGAEPVQMQPQVGDVCGNGLTCPVGSRCSSMPGRCYPVGRIDCGSYNCAPSEKCSVAGCVPQDAVECGNHVCRPGFKCSSNNGCLPQDAVDCGGGRFCNAGMKCATGNQCIAFDAVDCGNGRSCPAGNVCGNGSLNCLTPRQLEDQRIAAEQEQQFAINWNACKEYNISACEAALQLPQANIHQNRGQLLSWSSTARKFQSDLAACQNGSVTACDSAVVSPAASGNDHRNIEQWREAASPLNKLFAAISSLPQSAVNAGGIVIAFALILIAVFINKRRHPGSPLIVAEGATNWLEEIQAAIRAPLKRSLVLPSTSSSQTEGTAKPYILPEPHEQQAILTGASREGTVVKSEDNQALPPGIQSRVEGLTAEPSIKDGHNAAGTGSGSSTAALIFGILGGLFGLLVGLFGYLVGGIVGAGGQNGAGLFQLISIAIPIAGLVGGGMAKSNAFVAGVLMLLSAAGMLLVFGFNFFTAIPVVLSGVGGVMALISANDAKAKTT